MTNSQRQRLQLILEMVQRRMFRSVREALADIERQCEGLETPAMDNVLDGMEQLAREISAPPREAA